MPAEAAVLTHAETNEFEEAVRAALVARGLTVDMQAGASRYRIDLAVRDLLRQLVLQRMGWRIHRVWSTEWFHDPEQAISGIPRSVEQAEEAPVEHPVYAPHPDPEPPSPPSSPQCGEALGQDSRPV